MSNINSTQNISQLEHYLRGASRAISFIENWEINLSGKQKIGRYIAQNLLDLDLVVLDAGSTSFEIAKAIVLYVPDPNRLHILTNNLAVALCLTVAEIKCSFIGGEIDPLHFCALPQGVSPYASLLTNQPYTAIVTAAAIDVSEDGVAIRARKPDQFKFKQALLTGAAKKILALDQSKWLQPFDGVHKFYINGSEINLVIDELPSDPLYSNLLKTACQKSGLNLHVA